jgi:hypothetical protein
MNRERVIARLVALKAERIEIADRSDAFLEGLLDMMRAELVNRLAASLVVAIVIVHPRSSTSPRALGANLFTQSRRPDQKEFS